MVVRLLETGFSDAAANMAVDEAIFLSHKETVSVPTLRLYGWSRPSFSLGYSQDPDKILDRQACRKENIPIVRRPTGGGLIFHNDELTYSLVLGPADLDLPRKVKDSYYRLSSFLLLAYQELGLKDVGFGRGLSAAETRGIADFCFTRSEPYDILVSGRKLGGNAQKRAKNTILQHGCIPFSFDKNKIMRFLKKPEILKGLNSVSLNEADVKNMDFDTMAKIITRAFARSFNVDLKKDDLTEKEKQLTQRYLLHTPGVRFFGNDYAQTHLA